MLLVTIPALIFADNKHWGRRLASITGGVVQCFCMLTIGSLYAAGAVHANRGAARWVVIVLIYIFAIIFSATWAISFRVYVSEIQSSRTRAGATSLALSANWVSNLSLEPSLAPSDRYAGCQLDCGFYHPRFLVSFSVWSLFLVWRSRPSHCCRVYFLDARDQRQDIGGDRR
jgi:hypothetical protein